MTKLLFTLLIVFGISFSPFNNKELNATESDFAVTKTQQNVVKKRKQTITSDYDIETYDIYGNHQYYKYGDFEYNDSINLKGYCPVNVSPNKSEYDKYYSLPYSAICTFYTTYDTNGDGIADITFVGSGSLVGPDEVLTAEENTYHSDYGYAIDMYVALGEHREGNTLVRPFGVQHWTMIARGNYHTTFDANDNWALVRLDSSIGYTTGWLGVSETGISNGDTVKAIGYNNYSSCQAIVYQGVVSSLQTYKFNYNANPPAMSNGCPVMNSSVNTIYGIHCGQRVIVNNTTYCQACKISIYLKGWIQEDCGPIKVTIFSIADSSSSSSGPNISGHSWITVKNNSPYNITIGKMSISPNSGVSLGTWGNTVHIGLYYNLEYDRAQYFYGRVSYSRNIFSSQWNNDYVLNNDEWSLYDNCANFAVGLWNSMLSSQYSISFGGSWPTPSIVKNKILQFNGYNTNAVIVGNNNVGYYEGNEFHNSNV